MNLSIEELDSLSTGLIFDMFTEMGNDSYDYDILPTQDDFDRF